VAFSQLLRGGIPQTGGWREERRVVPPTPHYCNLEFGRLSLQMSMMLQWWRRTWRGLLEGPLQGKIGPARWVFAAL